MFRLVASVGCAFLLISVSQSSAGAAEHPAICGDRQELVQLLKERYGEVLDQERTEVAAIPSGEVYVSPSGTWSVVVEVDAKMHCIVSAGHFLKGKPDALKRKSA